MNRRDVLKSSALILGYTVSASAMTNLFVSCQAEAKINLNWKPVFLTDKQANTVAEMAETILPKTNTPSAKELGVPQFIDKMLKDLMSPDGQKEFLEGLKKLEDRCESELGKSFVSLDSTEREIFLKKVDKEAAAIKPPPSVWGITLVANPAPTPFFRQLKDLTLFGYYTSEKIGKEQLNYDPIPSEFVGCIPLSQVGGKAWTE